jgi:hypothetical protein
MIDVNIGMDEPSLPIRPRERTSPGQRSDIAGEQGVRDGTDRIV